VHSRLFRLFGLVVVLAMFAATYRWGKWDGYYAGGNDTVRQIAGLSDADRYALTLDVLCAAGVSGQGRIVVQSCLPKLSDADRTLAENTLAQLNKIGQ